MGNENFSKSAFWLVGNTPSLLASQAVFPIVYQRSPELYRPEELVFGYVGQFFDDVG